MGDKRKKRTSEEVERDILAYLNRIDHPRTTEDIAREINLNWMTADKYLRGMQEEKKVFMKKIGRQNQWWTEDVQKTREELRNLKEENRLLRDKLKRLESGS